MSTFQIIGWLAFVCLSAVAGYLVALGECEHRQRQKAHHD